MHPPERARSARAGKLSFFVAFRNSKFFTYRCFKTAPERYNNDMLVSPAVKIGAGLAAAGAIVTGGVYVATRSSAPPASAPPSEYTTRARESGIILEELPQEQMPVPTIRPLFVDRETGEVLDQAIPSPGSTLAPFATLAEPVKPLVSNLSQGLSENFYSNNFTNPGLSSRGELVGLGQRSGTNLPAPNPASGGTGIVTARGAAAAEREHAFSDSGRVDRRTALPDSAVARGSADTSAIQGANPRNALPPADRNAPAPAGSIASGGASSGVSGSGWETTPNCYKYSGAPQGKNIYITQTCNAGYRSNGKHPPIYFVDCGKENAQGCEEGVTPANYACLWQACKAGKSAIWDKDSKKCGCDDPGSNVGGTTDNPPSSGDEGGADNRAGNTPPDSTASGDQKANKERLKRAGVDLKDGAQVGGLRENSIKGVEKFSTEYENAHPGADVTITSGTEGAHTERITRTHAGGYKTDLRYSAQLRDYIIDTMSHDHGNVYYDSRGNRFYIEYAGSNTHVDIEWSGNNL